MAPTTCLCTIVRLHTISCRVILLHHLNALRALLEPVIPLKPLCVHTHITAVHPHINKVTHTQTGTHLSAAAQEIES